LPRRALTGMSAALTCCGSTFFSFFAIDASPSFSFVFAGLRSLSR
jgi:hypothetical protein